MELTEIIASRFISRSDVYAVQRDDGSYNPVNEPITRRVIEDHLSGNATYGHYLLGGNQINQVKFFCFDIDLATKGSFLIQPDLTLAPSDIDLDKWYKENLQGPFEGNPRGLWKNRDPQSRPYFKERLRTIGEIFTSYIFSNLQIPTCMTYSGHKGIHVYGFTGRADAAMVRRVAKSVISATNIFVPGRGDNFYIDGSGQFPGMELELFPKQDFVEPGHYGNLMRMEFGINKKSPNDPCFLVNQNLPHTQLAPRNNPELILKQGNPWMNEVLV